MSPGRGSVRFNARTGEAWLWTGDYWRQMDGFGRRVLANELGNEEHVIGSLGSADDPLDTILVPGDEISKALESIRRASDE